MTLKDYEGNVLKDVRPGDVIKIERVVKVTDVTVGHTYRSAQVRDVKTGRLAASVLDNGNTGTLKVTRVKRAKPKVGDVITGAEVDGTMWKRGTVISSHRRNGAVFFLTAEGYWIGQDGDRYGWGLPKDAKYTLLHIA